MIFMRMGLVPDKVWVTMVFRLRMGIFIVKEQGLKLMLFIIEPWRLAAAPIAIILIIFASFIIGIVGANDRVFDHCILGWQNFFDWRLAYQNEKIYGFN